MTLRTLVVRSLRFHWRTNLAVLLGVATATAVLAGALVVGDSVRGSLRDLALQRLGRTELAVSTAGFFRETVADDLRGGVPGATSTPLVIATGAVTHEGIAAPSGRRPGLRRGRALLVVSRAARGGRCVSVTGLGP